MSSFDLIKQYAIALASRGVPYIWGGENPLVGFDCSGLAQHLLAIAALDPPGDQTAQGLFDYFSKLPGAPSGPQPGALCFYGKDIRSITHIAMLLTPTQLVEAGGGGSECTSLEAARKKGACVRLRALGHRKDLVAIVGVAYPKIPE